MTRTEWHVVVHPGDVWTIQDRPNGVGEPIARQYGESSLANAKLIAAAPRLREALRDLYDACELRANREGGDFGPDIGPAAHEALRALGDQNGQ